MSGLHEHVLNLITKGLSVQHGGDAFVDNMAKIRAAVPAKFGLRPELLKGIVAKLTFCCS